MKKTLIGLTTLLLLADLTGSALACSTGNPACPSGIPSYTGSAFVSSGDTGWTFTNVAVDAVTPSKGIFFDAVGDSASYTFQLADFTPTLEANDTIYKFTLSVDFSDDRDCAIEKADIDLGYWGANSISARQDYTHTFRNGDATSIFADLNNTSGLLFTVTRNRGDFFLKSATIKALGCNYPTPPPPAPVPEPATMLLLGTGLVGLAGIRRKKA